jgi:hypothetical protein
MLPVISSARMSVLIEARIRQVTAFTIERVRVSSGLGI